MILELFPCEGHASPQKQARGADSVCKPEQLERWRQGHQCRHSDQRRSRLRIQHRSGSVESASRSLSPLGNALVSLRVGTDEPALTGVDPPVRLRKACSGAALAQQDREDAFAARLELRARVLYELE